MQSRTHSLIESLSNVLIGFLVSFVSQLVIFPLFDINVPLSDNFMIGLWFTVISIARSYVLRRCFNKKAL